MAKYDSKRLPTLVVNSKFYVYVDTGELVECEPLSTELFIDGVKENGDKIYSVINRFLANGDKVIETYDFNNIFTSVENFEKGITASLNYISLDEKESRLSVNVFTEILGSAEYQKPVYFIVDENGYVNERELDLGHLIYKYQGGGWNCLDAPEGEFYRTRSEAISFNKTKVVDKDGNETYFRGVNNLLLLDEDQKKKVEEFKKVLNSLIDFGIFIKTDLCDNIYAYNVRNIADYGHEMYDEEGFEKTDSDDKRFIVAHIEEYCEDNLLWIKRKEANNEDI